MLSRVHAAAGIVEVASESRDEEEAEERRTSPLPRVRNRVGGQVHGRAAHPVSEALRDSISSARAACERVFFRTLRGRSEQQRAVTVMRSERFSDAELVVPKFRAMTPTVSCRLAELIV